MIKKNQPLSLFLALLFLLPPASTYAATITPLSDIKGHWAERAIRYLHEYSYVRGYPDHSFLPNQNLTREEAASILSSVIGREHVIYSFFDDVKGRWSANSVHTLAMHRLVSGYEDRSFRPEQKITRAELATMVVSLLKDDPNLSESLTQVYKNDLFRDIEGSWARQSINALANTGLITGYPDQSFRPGQNITRAEICQMIYSVLQNHPSIVGRYRADPYFIFDAAHEEENGVVTVLYRSSNKREWTEQGTPDREEAKKLLSMINDLRAEKKLNPLLWDDELTKATDVRTVEILNRFDHQRPNKYHAYSIQPLQRMSGENIAYENSEFSAEEVFDKWCQSDTHYRNMIYPKHTRMAASRMQTQQGFYSWVLLFAKEEEAVN